MDGKTWQTSTEAQARRGKGPQLEHEEVRDAGGEGDPPNQSESWHFNYKEIKGHSSFN